MMENFEQQKEISPSDLEKEIGSRIEEMNSYQKEDIVDWMLNFRRHLSEIEKLLESETAKKFFEASVYESANQRLAILKENIEKLDISQLSDEDKEITMDILLGDLNKIIG